MNSEFKNDATSETGSTGDTRFSSNGIQRYLWIIPVLAVVGAGLYFVILPRLNPPTVGEEAFAAFSKYIAYAGEKNIEGVKSLSHQTSDACKDQARVEECNGLMDGVYNFGQVFKEDDFKHIVYDDRQIVMITDLLVLVGTSREPAPMRYALVFTRSDDGPKILAIKNCLPTQDPNLCIQSDPLKRDMDGNGWWDEVESFFQEAN